MLTLDFEDDCALIGIHSTEEDYRLAFLLNNGFLHAVCGKLLH